MRGLAVLAVVAVFSTVQAAGQEPVRAPGLAAVPGALTAKYKTTANQIIDTAMTDRDGYEALEYLCDHVGKRLSGTPQLNVAIGWGADLMRKANLENVRVQPVMVPHWVRGAESAAIVGPVKKPLHMLGLGMSVGTKKGGITAEVVFVPSFAALDALSAAQVKGKIVVFDPGWHGYGVNAVYRFSGPSRAAAKGAAAVLVRSATGLALQLPHTGTLLYDAKAPKVPAAAISVEDALLIERLVKQGPVTVHLEMAAHMEQDVEAGNVMGEIVGAEHPEQVVVIGGHIDSWDVGQGAQDDGSGIMGAYEAVLLIKKLGLKPKRTVRLVFWVNEENGGAGGRAYRDLVSGKIENQVAAIEMDDGAEKPLGMEYGSFVPRRRAAPAPGMATQDDVDLSGLPGDAQASVAVLRDIAGMLGPIGADTVSLGGGGSDIAPIVELGVPSLSPRTVGSHYFDWHHTEADTFDKVDLDDFRKDAAMLSVVTYVLADMDGRLSGQKGIGEE